LKGGITDLLLLGDLGRTDFGHQALKDRVEE
jgi:hypothetical protein